MEGPLLSSVKGKCCTDTIGIIFANKCQRNVYLHIPRLSNAKNEETNFWSESNI